MKKTVIMMMASLAAATGFAATPLWLRNPALSPDGKTLAFTYKGDVYTVGTRGGQARQLTTRAAYDSDPVWSPDGKTLAFSSTREGSSDVYVMPATGGTARRLTTNSGAERPLGFLNDSTVLFTARTEGAASTLRGPFASQLHTVSVRGGRPRLFQDVQVTALSVGPDGRILYQDKKGYEDVFRKHERSSSTADIWLLDNGKYTKLTDFNGPDQSPVWIDAYNMAYVS